MPCTLCHTCRGPIQRVLHDVEYCQSCRHYQRPLTHGYANPSPSRAELALCEAHTETKDTTENALWEDADIIHRYSRSDAINDGYLVEVPEHLRNEFGIRFHVALTRAVWDDYVGVPDDLKGQEDESGRLADILLMFHHAAKRADPGVTQLTFEVIVRQDRRNELPPPITLKAIVDGGDDGAGAITILKPNED